MQKEKERALTPAEQRRLEGFQAISRQLEQEGWQQRDLTVGVVYANVMALVTTLPICLLFVWLFFAVDRDVAFRPFGPLTMLLFFALFFALIVVHEGIHGLTWSLFTSEGRKSIEFGFIAKYLTPYCTCREPLGRTAYVLGLLMPMLTLGILPAVAGVLSGSLFTLAVGIVMIMGAGGDFTIFLKILSFRSAAKEERFLDHPTQVGLVVFTR